MGRTSSAALTLVLGGQVSAVRRPDPPHDLNDEQADEWCAIVERMPADWFKRETHPLLAAFCRHAIEARHLEQLIQREKRRRRLDVASYDKLLRMRERESRAMAFLGTKLRITQQSSFDRKKPRGAAADKPWET